MIGVEYDYNFEREPLRGWRDYFKIRFVRKFYSNNDPVQYNDEGLRIIPVYPDILKRCMIRWLRIICATTCLRYLQESAFDKAPEIDPSNSRAVSCRPDD